MAEVCSSVNVNSNKATICAVQIPSWPAPRQTPQAEEKKATEIDSDNKPFLMGIGFDVRTNLFPDRGAVKLSQQQTEVRDVISQSIRIFGAKLIFENAFPTSTGRTRWAKDALVSMLKGFQPEDFARAMENRIIADNAYFNRLASMVIVSIYCFTLLILTSYTDYSTRQ